MNPSPRTTEAVTARLDRACARTGLTPAELGVARIYDRPHSDDTEFGPLRGVDVLVKDLNLVAGEVTSFGSFGNDVVPTSHDTAVARLLQDGARLVGASVTAEFGATVYTEPAHGPGPVNPVDRRMTTGGSSSGAAVAVARGIVDVAHANDGGGSIRVPAAAVGLPGLKPAHTVGGGVLPNPAAQGVIARDLELTGRALGITHGGATGAGASAPGRRLNLGHTNRPFHTDTAVDPAVANATAAAASLLVTSDAVAGVRPVPAPYPVEHFEVYSRIMAARCRDLPDPSTVMPGWLRQQGRALSPAQVADSAAAVADLPAQVLDAWGAGDADAPVDVVVTPMLACAPPPVGAFSRYSAAGDPATDFLAQTAWTPWATLWNLTGWAGLSVPLVTPEHAAGRWPVSVHLGAVADRASAADLLGLASHLQDAVRRMIDADPAVLQALTLDGPGDITRLLQDTP